MLEKSTSCVLDGSGWYRLPKNEIPRGDGLNVECVK